MIKHRFINDPVYGLIPLGQAWYEMLNCPWIQRLRHIKQNGTLSLVFPGSEHSRFSHTIGVLHLTRKLAEILRDSAPLANGSNTYASPYTWLVYCLAALLHDSAQMPFSHATEPVYASIDPKDPDKGIRLLPSEQDQDKKPPEKWLSGDDLFQFGLVRAATELYPSLGTYHEKRGEDVCKAVWGQKSFPKQLNRLIEEDPLFNSLAEAPLDVDKLCRHVFAAIRDPFGPLKVVNPLKAGVDLDKLDYVQRDSSAAGTHYGHIALEHLLHHVSPACFRDDKGGQVVTLAFDATRLHALEHMIMGRYFLYANVIGHRSNLAWTTLLMAITIGLLEEDRPLKKWGRDVVSCLQNPKRLYLLTDDYINIAAGKYAGPRKELKELCCAWTRRESPHEYWSRTELVESPHTSPDTRRQTKRLNDLLDEFVHDKEQRRLIFPSVYSVRLLPREESDSPSETARDLTTCVLEGDPGGEARRIQDRSDSVMAKLHTCFLIFFRVFLWGPEQSRDELKETLDRADARRELDQHVDDFADTVRKLAQRRESGPRGPRTPESPSTGLL